MGPGLQICKYLVSRGLDVTIASDKRWTPSIMAIGAHVSPLVVGVSLGKKYLGVLEQPANNRFRASGEPHLMMQASGDE